MKIEFDAVKDTANIAKHGISLAVAEGFDFDSMVSRIDNRKDYGEVREIALGFIDGRLHILVYTRPGNARRIISLRKANAQERKLYNASQIKN